MDKLFEEWLKKTHLKECPQCQRDKKVRLNDFGYTSLRMFKEFYKEKNK